MRMMQMALSGTVIVVGSILTACIVEPASAAAPGTKGCTGQYRAIQNGQCVNTRFVNPNRGPSQDFTVYYRSKGHKGSSS